MKEKFRVKIIVGDLTSTRDYGLKNKYKPQSHESILWVELNLKFTS